MEVIEGDSDFTDAQEECQAYILPEGSPLRVQDMPVDEQPRERALRFGCHALTNAELLAIILRTGTRGMNILEMCRELMRQADGKISKLVRFTLEEFQGVQGMGQIKGLQLAAMSELIKRFYDEESESEVFTKSKDLYHSMRHVIGDLDHEEIWVIFLNRRLQKIKAERFTSGSDIASIFDVPAIMRRAVLHRARAMVLCHNHPSGNVTPSVQDDGITRKLKEAGKIFDINLVDHIIVTHNDYFSYNDNCRSPF